MMQEEFEVEEMESTAPADPLPELIYLPVLAEETSWERFSKAAGLASKHSHSLDESIIGIGKARLEQ